MDYLKDTDWFSMKKPCEVLDVKGICPRERTTKELPNHGDGTLLEEIILSSKQFPIPFPIETIKLDELKKSMETMTLERNIKSAYPVMHEKTLALFCRFLEFKRKYGNSIERNVYKNMNVLDLVDRMLLKRSVTFCGNRDGYMLLSKEEGLGGWEAVGTAYEKPPLVLHDCLSYDEMKLSALLYVSSRTAFINDGSRYNKGIVDPDLENSIQKTGVIIGLIGTRLSKKHVMEYEECVVSVEQNCVKNGFGDKEPSKSFLDKLPLLNKLGYYEQAKTRYLWRQFWFDFYKADSLTFDAAKLRIPTNHDVVISDEEKAISPLIHINDSYVFNNELYSKRISMSIDVLLLDANERAREDNTTAYVHVVGIGLGVWIVSLHQTNVFVRTFIARIMELMDQLHSVSDVHFAYFFTILPEFATDGMLLEDSKHPSGGIRLHISKREPSSKLEGNHSRKLLVESYAWDGNAQPGNDFWMGSLYSSGDPAAACSTQVSELHNSHINKEFVSGGNLHIAGRFGIKHIAEYCKLAAESQTS